MVGVCAPGSNPEVAHATRALAGAGPACVRRGAPSQAQIVSYIERQSGGAIPAPMQ